MVMPELPVAARRRKCHNNVTMPVVAANATQHTRRLSRRLGVQINRALESCDATAVHQVRVAIRRFTQAVAAWKPCFAAKDLRKTRRRLKKILSAAGEVRNCDVAHKFLLRWNIAHRDRLQSKLEARRAEAARVLIARLKRWTNPNLAAQDSSLEMAEHALHRLSRDFLEHGNEAASPKASPRAMHRFRIVAKKYRYTLELLHPSSPLVGSIKRVSALLGDINDCVAAAEIVPALASRLKKRQRKKIEAFRRCWAVEFAAPGRKPAASAQSSRRRSAA
jgi:CHAD domain-containing protein